MSRVWSQYTATADSSAGGIIKGARRHAGTAPGVSCWMFSGLPWPVYRTIVTFVYLSPSYGYM